MIGALSRASRIFQTATAARCYSTVGGVTLYDQDRPETFMGHVPPWSDRTNVPVCLNQWELRDPRGAAGELPQDLCLDYVSWPKAVTRKRCAALPRRICRESRPEIRPRCPVPEHSVCPIA